MKEFITNRPWKQWKTRKATFMYMLLVGTIGIVVGGIFMKFSTEWLHETLNFCKFVVGTGTVIILAPNIKALTKFTKGEDEEC